MPAYFDTGFSVRKPMWHGEGSVLDEYPENWEEARELAGLLWEPELAPAYAQILVPAAGPYPLPGVMQHERVSNVQLVRRNDTGETLGSVSDQFELITHAEMGNIIEALADVGGDKLKFETAGSCRGGAQVWALVYIDEPEEIAGDDTPTLPFIALLNAHDGSGSCKAVRTSIRVVCWNTYNAASMQGERSGLQYTFRHTKGAKARVADLIEDAKACLAGAREDLSEWKKMAEQLASFSVNEEQLRTFTFEFIPEPPADVISDRVRTNIMAARSAFTKLYEESPTGDGHRGNALGLVDAAVEYLDHVRVFRNKDTYLGRTLLRPEPLKAKAVNLALEAVGAGSMN